MEPFKFVFAVDTADTGQRLDKLISERMEAMTRSSAQRLIEAGFVLVNQKQCGKNYKLRMGDEIRLTIPAAEPMKALPEQIPLDIVYEDSDLLVVNKQKGMVVHPAPGHSEGTLVNALLFHCGSSLSGINGVIRPGIVHRIDKDTSGLLIVAKNDRAHMHLASQIQAHSFTRAYEMIVYGSVKEDGTVNAAIGRHPVDRKKMAVTHRHSREAVTHYQVLEPLRGFTYLRAQLETGRTHQIRVHMAYIGHPVAGDPVYGPKKVIMQLGGQCLHARQIGFLHPTTGQYMQFDSPLPAYFESFLKKYQ